jgi:endonuclease YncB( thermonuclease family)
MLIAILACTVIGIADGDTLRARCEVPEGIMNITVRIAEIDAPERRQPFGKRSRQHLADLCFGKPATVRQTSTDRYRRIVARVECDGTDASAAQVQAGMAWAFDRYVTDRTLYALQEDAQAARRGLWLDGQAVAPWDWRRRRPAKEWAF